MKNLNIAKEVIKSYSITSTNYQFIAQSGNVIYKVTDNNNKEYCLRLNISKDNALDEKWTNKQAINSEMLWLNHLSKYSQANVQKPYANNNNEFVTTINGVNCTLLSWLRGEHKPYVQTKQDALLLGDMIAKIHQKSAQYKTTKSFKRPSYNASYIESALAKLSKADEYGLNKYHIETLKKAGIKILNLYQNIEKSEDMWGLIHADIGCSNIIFNGDNVGLIDFGACGYGFYLRDIASLFGYTPLSLRKYVFEAYNNIYKLPPNYVQLTEAFFVAAILESLNFFLEVNDTKEWLANYINKLTHREILSFINNESFLYSGKPFWE